jgi:hypothetical protein
VQSSGIVRYGDRVLTEPGRLVLCTVRQTIPVARRVRATPIEALWL